MLNILLPDIVWASTSFNCHFCSSSIFVHTFLYVVPGPTSEFACATPSSTTALHYGEFIPSSGSPSYQLGHLHFQEIPSNSCEHALHFQMQTCLALSASRLHIIYYYTYSYSGYYQNPSGYHIIRSDHVSRRGAADMIWSADHLMTRRLHCDWSNLGRSHDTPTFCPTRKRTYAALKKRFPYFRLEKLCCIIWS